MHAREKYLRFELTAAPVFLQDPLNGPKEISFFCASEASVNVAELDSSLQVARSFKTSPTALLDGRLQSRGYCLALNIGSNFLESKLLLKCK